MGSKLFRTSLCDMLGIEYPVLLAGMWVKEGRATPPPLVAAVSNAGGLGVMGGLGLEPATLRQRIRQIRQLTDKPFGVDLLFPAKMAEVEEDRERVRQRLEAEYPEHTRFVRGLLRDFGVPPVRGEGLGVLSPSYIRKQVEVVLEEGVPVLVAALGDASWAVELAHQQGTKVMGLAGSLRNARRQLRSGVDIIIAQGYEAGGHTGTIANFVLIPQVVEAVAPTPVVAGGGIAGGQGLVAALALGAAGVWCGTAFLVAEECEVWGLHKEQIVKGATEDFVVTYTYTGKPARDYRNEVIEIWERSGPDPLPMPLQGVLMDDFVEAAERAGRLELINNPAGQIAGMLNAVRPAREILEEMVEEAIAIYHRLHREVRLED